MRGTSPTSVRIASAPDDARHVATHSLSGSPIFSSQRILVVSLDNLGDLVFTSALTRVLRRELPGAEVTLWCKRYTAELGPLLPGVDIVESAEPFWDRSPGGRSGSASLFLKSIARLHRRRFDVALLAAAPWRTAAATWATGARQRIGLARQKNARWLTHALPPEDVNRPVLSELARLLAPLGIRASQPLHYELDAGPLEARRHRFRAVLGARPVALHPFASKRNRCVPLAEWIRLARALAERGYEPLWIGSGPELLDVRRAAAGTTWRYVDALGEGTLGDTAAALSLAQLFVGHDSGPLHVAGAFGVPVVGVFTPGEPRRTFPQGLGDWRMVIRDSPIGVTAEDLLASVDELPRTGALRLVR